MITLETPRLRLRPFTPDDAPAYHQAVYGDADVMRYLPGGVPRPFERMAEIITWMNGHWETRKVGGLAVIDKAMDTLIGHAGLSPLHDGGVEIFYALSKPYWGKGLTTEAASAIAGYAFTGAELETLLALAVPENTASRRVMEKIGMTFQGLTTDHYQAELALYQQTVDEWRAMQGTNT
jgi:RimJ/RimL family protein N-acetyltransferase